MRPTLILSHNKTLAAQLYTEMKGFFPHNAVEYYVSYYDYYQPEAYIASTDTYIEKDLAINDDLDKLRLAATSTLLSGRKDVVVVSSVSCIYGMGNPAAFYENVILLRTGQTITMNVLLRRLVDSLYTRNDVAPSRGNFRVKGDTVDIFLAYADDVLRINFWGDEIDGIEEVDGLTGARLGSFDEYKVYPANLFMTTKESQDLAIRQIQDRLGGASRALQRARQNPRSPTSRGTRELRPRNDSRTRPLLGHRKLFALLRRPPTGHAPLLSARLFPERLSARHRREPRQCATNPRHVRRRPLAQREFGQLRFPTPRRARQPPAQI